MSAFAPLSRHLEKVGRGDLGKGIIILPVRRQRHQLGGLPEVGLDKLRRLPGERERFIALGP